MNPLSEKITLIATTWLADWRQEKRLQYLAAMARAVTICIRDVGAEEGLADTKLATIKQLNEFHHWLSNAMLELIANAPEDPDFIEQACNTLAASPHTQGYIDFILFNTFERIKTVNTGGKFITTQGYYLLNQALNEICSGPEAIPEWEFHSRVGVDKAVAYEVLNSLRFSAEDLADVEKQPDLSFLLVQNPTDNSVTLRRSDQPVADQEQVLLQFFANSYNEAMAIRNRFMDWEPYQPLPKHIAAQRVYDLVDAHQTSIGTVTLTFYQPIPTADSDWLCNYQITGIGNDQVLGIFGVDGVQALLLARHIAQTILENFNADHHDCQIAWLGTVNDFGLDLPNNGSPV